MRPDCAEFWNGYAFPCIADGDVIDLQQPPQSVMIERVALAGHDCSAMPPSIACFSRDWTPSTVARPALKGSARSPSLQARHGCR